MSKQPGGKSHRGADGFHITGRDINDQPLNLSTTALFQLAGDQINMPVVQVLA